MSIMFLSLIRAAVFLIHETVLLLLYENQGNRQVSRKINQPGVPRTTALLLQQQYMPGTAGQKIVLTCGTMIQVRYL